MDREYPQDLQEIIRFHGHVCPGLIIGYRAAKAALSCLGVERSEDEELVAIVETDACGIDAVQALLGCTLGRGNLIFHDHGKHVFTVISREKNMAFRIAMKSDALTERTPEQEALLRKVRGGVALPAEQQAYEDFQKQRIGELLKKDEDSLFKIEPCVADIPEKARLFPSLVCQYCGERVMEPRARIRGGKTCCIPCAETYTRGW